MKKKEIALPLWMPIDAWTGYLEMRRRIHKPMTEYAKKLAINKLAELAAQGQSPTAVLEQSIFHSWQGLFPLREVHTCTHTNAVGSGPIIGTIHVNPAVLERERLRRLGQTGKK